MQNSPRSFVLGSQHKTDFHLQAAVFQTPRGAQKLEPLAAHISDGVLIPHSRFQMRTSGTRLPTSALFPPAEAQPASVRRVSGISVASRS